MGPSHPENAAGRSKTETALTSFAGGVLLIVLARPRTGTPKQGLAGAMPTNSRDAPPFALRPTQPAFCGQVLGGVFAHNPTRRRHTAAGVPRLTSDSPSDQYMSEPSKRYLSSSKKVAAFSM